MHERVIGQDKAISAVVVRLDESRSGIKDENRQSVPSCSFSPGVGKTELAKHWQQQSLALKGILFELICLNIWIKY